MTIRELLAARTAPGTWWTGGTIDPSFVAGPDGDSIAIVHGNLVLGGEAHENARAIVAMDHIIDPALAVVEAARAEHFLYARNQSIERADDDPAWCACGVPADGCGTLALIVWFDAAVEGATRSCR